MTMEVPLLDASLSHTPEITFHSGWVPHVITLQRPYGRAGVLDHMTLEAA
jgi:hypothetical protein